MKSPKTDRRSERTRHTLTDALIRLMMQKPYHLITVQDIIDQANVGRSTFYAHYQDKDDLLTSSFEQVLAVLVMPHGETASDQLLQVTGLFEHLQDHYHLYQALLRGQGVELIFKNGQAYLSQKLEAQLVLLKPAETPEAVPLPILAHYLASTLFVLLKWWLDNKMPYTPQRMDEIFQQLVMPGVQKILQRG